MCNLTEAIMREWAITIIQYDYVYETTASLTQCYTVRMHLFVDLKKILYALYCM